MKFQRSFARCFYRLFPAIRPVCITPKNLSMVFDAAFQNNEPQLYKGRGVLLKAREAEVRFYDNFDRGWTGMFADGLEIHEIPANHTTILCEPSGQEVGRKFASVCERRNRMKTTQMLKVTCTPIRSVIRGDVSSEYAGRLSTKEEI